MQGLKASTLRPQCPLWVKSGHVRCKTHVRFVPIADIVPLIRLSYRRAAVLSAAPRGLTLLQF